MDLQRRMVRGTNPQQKPGTAVGMHKQVQKLPPNLRAGNVGNINEVIWPFWFTASNAELAPNAGVDGFFTITQEAAFIIMAMSKVVFLRSGQNPNYIYTAIDGNNPDEALSGAPDLTITMRDAQSRREFFGQALAIDFIGTAEFPTALPNPQLLLPNSALAVSYANNHASNVYVPFITLFGYRCRIEDAQNILSTITG